MSTTNPTPDSTGEHRMTGSMESDPSRLEEAAGMPSNEGINLLLETQNPSELETDLLAPVGEEDMRTLEEEGIANDNDDDVDEKEKNVLDESVKRRSSILRHPISKGAEQKITKSESGGSKKRRENLKASRQSLETSSDKGEVSTGILFGPEDPLTFPATGEKPHTQKLFPQDYRGLEFPPITMKQPAGNLRPESLARGSGHPSSVFSGIQVGPSLREKFWQGLPWQESHNPFRDLAAASMTPQPQKFEQMPRTTTSLYQTPAGMERGIKEEQMLEMQTTKPFPATKERGAIGEERMIEEESDLRGERRRGERGGRQLGATENVEIDQGNLVVELRFAGRKLAKYMAKQNSIGLPNQSLPNQQEQQQQGRLQRPTRAGGEQKQEQEAPIEERRRNEQFPPFAGSGERDFERKYIIWLTPTTLPLLRSFSSAYEIFRVLRTQHEDLGTNNCYLNLCGALLETLVATGDPVIWKTFRTLVTEMHNPDLDEYIKYIFRREEGQSFHITRIANPIYDSLPKAGGRYPIYLPLFRLDNCKRQLARCLLTFFQRMMSFRCWYDTMSFKEEEIFSSDFSYHHHQQQVVDRAGAGGLSPNITRTSRQAQGFGASQHGPTNLTMETENEQEVEQEAMRSLKKTSLPTLTEVTKKRKEHLSALRNANNAAMGKISFDRNLPSRFMSGPEEPLDPNRESDFWYNHYVYLLNHGHPSSTVRKEGGEEGKQEYEQGGGEEEERRRRRQQQQQQLQSTTNRGTEEGNKREHTKIDEEQEEEGLLTTTKQQDNVDIGGNRDQQGGEIAEEGGPPTRRSETTREQGEEQIEEEEEEEEEPQQQDEGEGETLEPQERGQGIGEGGETDPLDPRRKTSSSKKEDREEEKKKEDKKQQYQQRPQRDQATGGFFFESTASRIVPFSIQHLPSEMINLHTAEQDVHVFNLLQEFCVQGLVTNNDLTLETLPHPQPQGFNDAQKHTTTTTTAAQSVSAQKKKGEANYSGQDENKEVTAAERKETKLSYLSYCAALGQIRLTQGLNQLQFIDSETGDIIYQKCPTSNLYTIGQGAAELDDGSSKPLEQAIIIQNMSVELTLTGKENPPMNDDEQEDEAGLGFGFSQDEEDEDDNEEYGDNDQTGRGTKSPPVLANLAHYLVDRDLEPYLILDDPKKKVAIQQLRSTSKGSRSKGRRQSKKSQQNKLVEKLDLISRIEKSQHQVSASLVNEFFDHDGFLFCQPVLNLKNLPSNQSWKLNFGWECMEGSQNLMSCYILSAYLHSLVYQSYSLHHSKLRTDDDNGNQIAGQVLKNLKQQAKEVGKKVSKQVKKGSK